MKVPVVLGIIGIASVAIGIAQLQAGGNHEARKNRSNVGAAQGLKVQSNDDGGGIAGDSVGPDVAVCVLPTVMRWGTLNGYTAYSVGTSSVNFGDTNLAWVDGSPNHPVIGQNLFRLKDGRFEQIGQSWLKHGFCALQQTNACDTCQAQMGCLSFLKPGCRDPYSADLNGGQGGLGPKSEVNASTGVFPWPYSTDGVTGNVLYKRIQVLNTDLDPALNAGALYFVEGQYVAADDAAFGNQFNNASYRRVTVGPAPNFNLTVTGDTQVTIPALVAWQANDPAVVVAEHIVPNDGKYMLGYKVADNGNGTWHYEYALYNMNSHRSAASFAIPLPAGVNISNVGFHDVDYHSGDGEAIGIDYDDTDWSVTTDDGFIQWATQTYAENANANALRWGTVYNFRFDADVPPDANPLDSVVKLYREAEEEGDPAEFSLAVAAPSTPVVCLADLDVDGEVGPADLADLLAAWGTNPGSAPDFDASGNVGPEDLATLLAAWGDC